MRKNVSGQAVYFTLVSAISGNPVTGASGAISGRKALDLLSGYIVLSGNIIELGGGGYRANLYDFDCNSNQVGYLFTASGCVPVQYQFDMIDGNASGGIYLASGQSTAINSGNSVLVYSGQLSGQVINWISGQGVTLLSGQSVLVYSGQLSGQVINWISGQGVTLLSGQSVLVYSGQLSGQRVTADVRFMSGEALDSAVAQVGVNVVTAVSGVVNIASGPFVVASLNSGQLTIPYSGSLSGQRITWLSGQTVALLSGQSVLVYSGQLSGQRVAADVQFISGEAVDSAIAQIGVNVVTAVSGVVQIASGPFVVASLNSGQLTIPYSGSLSGQRITWLSGQTVTLNSGQIVGVYSGNLSGQQLTAQTVLDKSGYAVQSGDVYPASGVIQATVTSGSVFLASGQAVSLNSGQSVLLYSGQSVLVYSGQLSGQFTETRSGRVFLNSGYDTVSIPRGLLRVDMSGMSGEADFSPLNALRKLRNTWSLSGTNLDVYKEDGTTVAFSQTATATSGVQPVTGLG